MRARKKHAREPWKKIYGNLEPRVYFIVVRSDLGPRLEFPCRQQQNKNLKAETNNSST